VIVLVLDVAGIFEDEDENEGADTTA
jgi:hypothetical protein